LEVVVGFFEGTASQMFHALLEVVACLPKETEVYCGHEYTAKNLEFALTIEPENKAVQEKFAWARARRGEGLTTIPSTVEEELAFNPFCRVALPSVAEAVGLRPDSSPVDVMAALRTRKDGWKSAF